jgi:CHAT domain-containing protein/Tfp pilus assembly protein PilF
MAPSCAGRAVGVFVAACSLLALRPQPPPPERAATEQELVAALEAAATDAERTALLEREPRLLALPLRKALSARGAELQSRDDHTRAFALHEMAYRVARQIDDQAGVAAALDGLGQAHYARGDFELALRSHQESLALYEALSDKAGVAKALNEVGKVLWRRGDYPAALARLDRSLAISEAIGSKAGVASAWLQIGTVRYLQSDYPAALESYQKSVRLSEETGDRQTLSKCLNNIGMIHKRQGDSDLALQYFRRSLELDEQLGSPKGVAYSLNNMATIYYRKGDYARALASYQKSLELKEGVGDKGTLPTTLANIGQVHERQANYDLALQYQRRALAISEEIASRRDISTSLLKLGITVAAQGKHGEALGLYARALALYEALENKEGAAETLNAMGLATQALGDYALALERYRASCRRAEEAGLKEPVALALANIAEVENLQGNHGDAMRSAERAAQLAQDTGARDALWRARCEQGKAYRALGALSNARAALEAAVGSIESLREDLVGGPQDSQRFLEGKLVPYHELVALLLADGLPREAFGYAERAKARLLLDVLHSGQVNITKAMTASDQERERSLTRSLVTLGAAVRQEASLAKPDATRLADLRLQLENARLDYESFRTSLHAAYPELKAVRGEVSPVSVEEAIGLLPDQRSVLLEYLVTAETTYLFVLTEGAGPLRVHPLQIRKQDLTERVSAFRQRLERRDLNLQASAAELHDLLLEPARAQIEGRSQLIIVPDDVLWDLPFQALRGARGRYLLQDHAISYAPSLTALREMVGRRRPAQGRGTVLALGNPALHSETAERIHSVHRDAVLAPLPHAEREVKELAQLYGKERSHVYVGAAADEARAKAESGGSRVLHFATHGILNEASPMYSQLVLSPSGDKEDGLLEAWEILNLDLNADLAVLSACETGRGRVGAGEGVIGLSWALFVAGCPTTVVSQWKVDSASTTELMLAFHRNLRKGQAKAAALQSAALKVLADSRYRHPFYWAGFVVVGDAR